MTLVHRSAILVASVTGLGIAAACSSSDSGPTGPRGDCILPTTSNFVDSAQGRVVMRNLRFTPENITIRKGMSVKWVYCEEAGSDFHTVTSDDGLWESDPITGGGSYARVFATVAEFEYHCIPHESEMRGVVTVVD